MFRLLVIGKTDEIANEAAEWIVSGEKVGDNYEKKYDIEGRTMHINAIPLSLSYEGPEKAGDGLLLVAKSEDDLSQIAPMVEYYSRMPIKFIVVDDGVPAETEYEVKWGAKVVSKKTPTEFIEKLIKLNNEVVKLIAAVFKSFDKDGNGFIEIKEIQAVCKELGAEISEEEAAEFMSSKIDTNNDQKISMEEFMEWWKTGRKDKSGKMGGLVDTFMKNPMFKKIMKAAKKAISGVEAAEFIEGNIGIHVNKVTIPGVSLNVTLMTKGEKLETAFQQYAGATGVVPNLPFLGISFGVNNPEDAGAKVKDIIENAVAMASMIIPPAEEALSHVDFKYGVGSNSSFVCVAPSEKGKAFIEPLLAGASSVLGLIAPGQSVNINLAFASDLNKLITEDRPPVDILLDGISFEVETKILPGLTEISQKMIGSLIPGLPPQFSAGIASAVHTDKWVKSGKFELEFEVDQALKEMIKGSIGEGPASIALKDLKPMFAPQAAGFIEAMPIAEMAHTFLKDEVTSIEFFVYAAGHFGFKVKLTLPGLGPLISF